MTYYPDMEVLLDALNISPVKSMRLQAVDGIYVDASGLFGDRELMVVEAEPHTNVMYKPGEVAVAGQFLSQREDPKLAHFTPTLTRKGIQLSLNHGSTSRFIPFQEETPGNQRDVRVWKWQGSAVDQGDFAANYISDYIGRAVRLVRMSESKPRYVEGDQAKGRVGFADGFPLLIFSRASVDKVNEWIGNEGGQPISPDRFRGTLILDGIEAFEEDYLESITIVHEGLKLILERAKACARCPIPEQNELTGDYTTKVRAILGKNGRSGIHIDPKYGPKTERFFGQNFRIRMPQNLQADTVIPILKGALYQAKRSFETNWVSKRAA